MELVIVGFKLDWDYWDEYEGYCEVMVLVDNFFGWMFN